MTEKAKFIKQFNEAFAKNDVDFILESITSEIVWEMVGNQTMAGKEAVAKELKAMEKVKTLAISVTTIITHGRTASANGTMQIKEPDGTKKHFGFCDVYEFSGFKNPKIKKITSYIIPIKNN